MISFPEQIPVSRITSHMRPAGINISSGIALGSQISVDLAPKNLAVPGNTHQTITGNKISRAGRSNGKVWAISPLSREGNGRQFEPVRLFSQSGKDEQIDICEATGSSCNKDISFISQCEVIQSIGVLDRNVPNGR